MLTLNTDFYNYQIAAIRQQADLTSDLYNFVKIISQIEKCNPTSTSMEDLSEEGSGSVASIAKGFIRILYSCFKWCLDVVGKVLKFLIHGYQPGFKKCVSLINKISAKLPSLQAYHYNYIVPLKALELGSQIIEKHINTNIPNLGQSVPSGRIDKIRAMYIEAFNKLQLSQGQIDSNFSMQKPPKVANGKLKDFGIHKKQDLTDIINKFDEIHSALSGKLNELRKGQCYKIRQIMNRLQDQNFSTKFVKNKVAVTESLIAVFESAIVGQDTKWMKSMQNSFLKELQWYAKKAESIVAAKDTDEEDPEKEYHEKF